MKLEYELYFFLSEPHERNGRLLRGQDEALRGTKNGKTHSGSFRLYRIHTHPVPELMDLVNAALFRKFDVIIFIFIRIEEKKVIFIEWADGYQNER